MLNGALYIRVSTHMQDELSPDAQKRLLLDYAREHDISILNKYIFIEKGVSGRTAHKRPVFQKMIATAKTSPTPFHVILVWKFSRFARNQEESIVYKSLLKKQYNIRIISISEPVSDDPFGALIERIIEWMDEYYSMRLSDEVKRGMTEKALRGGYQCKAPLGYEIRSKGAPLTVDPVQSQTIQIIFHKFVQEHKSCHDIALYLNTMGFHTSQGNLFQKRSVEYILKNPVYCGRIQWKNESINGIHAPIISGDLYDKAQERFSLMEKKPSVSFSSTPAHYLSGLVKCPECGRSMVVKKVCSKKNNKTYFYFSCYGNLSGSCSNHKNIRISFLEKHVCSSLQFFFKKYGHVDNYVPHQDYNPQLEIKLVDNQIKKIQQKEGRIFNAYTSGVDSLDEYTSKKRKNDTEKQRLVKVRKELVASVPFSCIHTVSEVIDSDQYTTIQKNRLLKSIIYKIIYDPEKDSLLIYYLV